MQRRTYKNAASPQRQLPGDLFQASNSPAGNPLNRWKLSRQVATKPLGAGSPPLPDMSQVKQHDPPYAALIGLLGDLLRTQRAADDLQRPAMTQIETERRRVAELGDNFPQIFPPLQGFEPDDQRSDVFASQSLGRLSTVVQAGQARIEMKSQTGGRNLPPGLLLRATILDRVEVSDVDVDEGELSLQRCGDLAWLGAIAQATLDRPISISNAADSAYDDALFEINYRQDGRTYFRRQIQSTDQNREACGGSRPPRSSPPGMSCTIARLLPSRDRRTANSPPRTVGLTAT